MMRELLAFFLMFHIGFSFISETTIDVVTGVVLSGGSGIVTILESPLSTPWQTADCTVVELRFPPYFRTVNCTVDRVQNKEIVTASYDSSPLINFTPQMQNFAQNMKTSSIFETSVKLSDWVFDNVEYDLQFANLTESAKEVFQSRSGTCDEFTHLFLSFVKSLGYDARYVSGFAYGDQGWLPHAWAEVKTEYGWLPFDTTFGQYGAIDALHISTYKGNDGNNSFVQASYTGDTTISEYFSLTILSTKNISFNLETTSEDVGVGGDILIKITAVNPFNFPVGFSSQFTAPTNFEMKPLHTTDYLILNPGSNEIFWVFEVEEINKNSILQVPYLVSFAREVANSSFKISGERECTSPEEFPMEFKLENCMNLKTGELVNDFVSGGNFICGDCFYSLVPRNEFIHVLDYPSGCFEGCELSILMTGMSYVDLKVNDDLRKDVLVQNEHIETFVVLPGKNEVVVNGDIVDVFIEELPIPTFEEDWDGKTLCLTSNWELTETCFDLSCGEHRLDLFGVYELHELPLSYSPVRDCNLFQKGLETVINFFRSFFGG